MNSGNLLGHNNLQYDKNSNYRRDWENPDITHINRRLAHAPWGAYETEAQALTCDRNISSKSLSLDGSWKFKLVGSPETVPEKFWNRDYDTSSWEDIVVPGNWEVQGFGTPVYSNFIYPFTLETDEPYLIKPSSDKETKREYLMNPPFVPENNPTGCYVRSFEIPSAWKDESIFINFGGVESCFYLWINGEAVGYSQDSKLSAEFDISLYIKAGVNIIALQVMRWCAGVWLEDQDYWYLSGIFRSVRIFAKPSIHISDWFIRAIPDEYGEGAELSAEVFLDKLNGYADYKVELKLIDKDSNLIIKETRAPVLKELIPHKHGCIQFSIKPQSVDKWTPETPYLYTVLLTLISPEGQKVDFESCRAGFRRIEIKDGIIHFNGIRMIFRGVNRHEHALRTGRTVSKEHMVQEIKLMKQLNFNSVRTCHYPDDPIWYELCDEYGLCIVCEANVETHGVWGSLSNDPAWAAAYLERAIRMVLIHKNHPSIVSWSMGNESDKGPHHASMANWVRYYDPTRIVQYESENPGSIISDIWGEMYATPELITEVLANAKEIRPIVLIEYLYQIRNAGGSMYRFSELLEKFDRFQGGFVWDWQDKCLIAKDDKGNEFPGYGGDFNEDFVEDARPTFMTCNGVVLVDLTPKPVAYEVKNVQSPIQIDQKDCSFGNFRLRNRHISWDTSHYSLMYKIYEDGESIEQGTIPVPFAGPMSEAKFNIDLDDILRDKKGYEYFITFCIGLNDQTSWAGVGHDIYQVQFTLPYGDYHAEDVSYIKAGLEETDTEYVITSKDLKVIFNKKEAIMTSCEKDSVKYIELGAFAIVSRPQCGLDPSSDWGLFDLWSNLAQLKRSPESIMAYNLPDGRIRVDIKSRLASENTNHYIYNKISYIISGDGSIRIETEIDADPTFEYLPRTGIEMVLPDGFEVLQWYGRGPGENYSDRKESTPVGKYESTVSKQHFPFVPPSECGGHEDTRWLRLTDKILERSILVKSRYSFHFDVHHSDIEDYRAAAHDHELKIRDKTFLHLDYRHAGIGSNMSRSAEFEEKFMIPAGVYCFSFDIYLE